MFYLRNNVSRRLHLCPLKPKQPPFAPQSTAVPRKASITADDAVAGNDNGNGIFAVGGANRPAGIRLGEDIRNSPVLCGLAVWDSLQLPPHGFLKIRAGGLKV